MERRLPIADRDSELCHPTTQLTSDHVLVRGVSWEKPGRVGIGSRAHARSALDVGGDKRSDGSRELDRLIAESDVDQSIALLDIGGAQRTDPGDRLGEKHDKAANNSVAKRDSVVGKESAEDLLAMALR